jgi:hypothetical protein
VVGILVFFDMRVFVVRRSFGEYGHYRRDEVAQAAALPITYARRQTFEECHLDVLAAERKGSTPESRARCATDRRRNIARTRLSCHAGSHRRSQASSRKLDRQTRDYSRRCPTTELEPTSLTAVHWQKRALEPIMVALSRV